MELKNKEIKDYILRHANQIAWISLLYPSGLFFLSQIYSQTALFKIAFLSQIILVSIHSYVCFNYKKNSTDLWEKYFYISRTLVSICIGLNLAGCVSYEPAMSISLVLTAATFSAALETLCTCFHPNLKFLYFTLLIIAVPILTQAYNIFSDINVLPLVIVATIYLFSIAFRGYVLNRSFCESVKIKAQHLESQQRISKILDAMPAKVTWIDEDLKYLEVNDTMVQAYGLTRSDYINQNVGFQDPNGAAALVHVLNEFKKSNKESLVLEAPLRFRSDLDVIHSIQIKKILNKASNEKTKLEFIIVAVDLTEHKKTQTALEEEKLRNLQSARLSSIGEMAAGIAHEIRNPLAILQGNLNVLEKEVSGPILNPEKIQLRITKLHEHIKRISGIISSMQRLVRDSSNLELDWYGTNSLLEDPIALSSQRFKQSEVQFEIYADEQLNNYEIFCQPQQIGQVLLNLLNNAHDALSEQNERKLRLTAELTQRGGFKICVIDNGPGVKDQTKLFNPFYTTKAPGFGTGLGLSVSKKMIEQNRGTLSYHRIDEKTHFILEFPADSIRQITNKHKPAA